MEYLKTDLLSIDAWRDSEGWNWNQWYTVEKGIYFAVSELTPRKILAYLRKAGFLTAESKGRLRVEDDGYNYVIEDRNTSEPILALAYGEYID